MECKFKSLKRFKLTAPNITTHKSQFDKTEHGMELELVSWGTLKISSHPLQVESIKLTACSNDEGKTMAMVDNSTFIVCTQYMY